MRIRRLEDLFAPGHVVALRISDSAVLGRTWQPECIEDGCGYRGPHLETEARAQALAAEHRAKSIGRWKAAR